MGNFKCNKKRGTFSTKIVEPIKYFDDISHGKLHVNLEGISIRISYKMSSLLRVIIYAYNRF